MKFYEEIIGILKKKKLSKDSVAKLKLKLCKKHKLKKIPTDIEILLNAKPNDLAKLKHLQTKPVRTASGVAVVAIMTKPRKCPHGACIMCPSYVDKGVPQSYTGKEPAARRAIRNKFDPYLQVMNRLEQYIVTGHVPDKIELIIMGGTFPSYPVKYQDSFVTYAFKAMNDFGKMFFKGGSVDIITFKKFFELPGDINDAERGKRIEKKLMKLKGKSTLIKSQIKNEKSVIKCVGLTIETRPDYAKLKHAKQMLKLGCTRVEVGVQSVYDDVLKYIKRGHTNKETIECFRILKDLGFKINAHYMPGLPKTKKERDLLGMIHLFASQDYRPDMLKIYPCMVIPNTKLYKLWKQKKYKPLTTKEAAELIAEFKPFVPRYVRIMRVQRDIPTYMTAAGVDRTNLRQYIAALKPECECIRCREIGKQKIKGKPQLQVMHYEASNGSEFFISLETKKHIVGFCRLRFPSIEKGNIAIVRELHVYGQAAAIGKKGKVQHKGYGKILLQQAEHSAKDYHREKLLVISGVGVRNYYRKLGYKKEGAYMVKKI